MDRHRLVELSLGHAHLQRHRKALQYLVGTFAEQVDAYERAILSEAMSRHEGNIAAVSESLNLPKKTLYDKLKRFNLAIETFR